MATELLELGRVRLSNLGQPSGFQLPTPVESKPDADRIYSLDELQSQALSIDNKEDALNVYKILIRLQAIRSKVSFISDAWFKVKSDQSLTMAFQRSEEGKVWVDLFTKAEGAFRSFTQPNYEANLSLAVDVMEINALALRWKVGVIGRKAFYTAGMPEMGYRDTSTVQGDRETYNFGDLSKTNVFDDFNEVVNLAKGFDLKIQMGNPLIALLLAAVIMGGLSIMSYFTYKGIEAFRGINIKVPQEILDILDRLKDVDPKKAGDILQQLLEVLHLVGSAGSILMWIAIGAGVLVVGFIGWHLLSVD